MQCLTIYFFLKKFNSGYIIVPLSGLKQFRKLWHTLVLALKHPKVRLKQPKWPLLHVNFPHKSEMFNCHILINVSQSWTTSNKFTYRLLFKSKPYQNFGRNSFQWTTQCLGNVTLNMILTITFIFEHVSLLTRKLSSSLSVFKSGRYLNPD